jgi:hypothetical protein
MNPQIRLPEKLDFLDQLRLQRRTLSLTDGSPSPRMRLRLFGIPPAVVVFGLDKLPLDGFGKHVQDIAYLCLNVTPHRRRATPCDEHEALRDELGVCGSSISRIASQAA